MDTSGRTHEGWMTLVPVTILLFIVVTVLGGPVAFMNRLGNWGSDLASYVVRFVKDLS